MLDAAFHLEMEFKGVVVVYTSNYLVDLTINESLQMDFVFIFY